MSAYLATVVNCLKTRHLSKRVSDIFVGLRLPSILFFMIGSAFLFPESSLSQTRVDLEDLNVKGELLKDNRMRMSARESTRIQDRVKYRKNFRPEIIDGIDLRLPAAETLEEVESK
jgi:hypothetical protein